MASSSSNLQDYMQRHGKRSPKNIHSLPTNQMTVMRLLSEPKEMPYKALCKAVEDLPESERLNQSQLDGTLYELVSNEYLTSFMESGDVVYMVLVNLDEAPPPSRQEQRLMRKLDLGDLNLNETSDKTDDKSDDLPLPPMKNFGNGIMRKLDLSDLNLDELSNFGSDADEDNKS